MTQLYPRTTNFFEPAPAPRRERPADEVFGSVVCEVALPSADHCPELEGWILRLWPQARLGDATLEARRLGSQRAEELLDGLRRQGVTVLGPLHQRRP